MTEPTLQQIIRLIRSYWPTDLYDLLKHGQRLDVAHPTVMGITWDEIEAKAMEADNALAALKGGAE